jgi:uroporphyrinogen decarboxylase
MTRRERFYAAVTHGSPDRAVLDLCGSMQTIVDAPCVKDGLARLLGIENPNHGVYSLDERILVALDIDTRRVGGFPLPATRHEREEGGVRYDAFGIGRRFINDGWEIVHCPLKDAPISVVEGYELPDPSRIDARTIEAWAAKAERLHRETEYAVIAEHPVLGVFEIGCWMFGFEDYLYRMLAEPEIVHAFSRRVLEFQKQTIAQYYGAMGAYIDGTTSGDDFGTQKAPFLSKDLFDAMIAPYFRERIQYTKQFTQALYQHHTCGSVFDLIPSLIDCGVDILNPIQPGVYKMEPERLKETYGGRIAFWGGIDTQHLLPYGTTDEVKAEVWRVLSFMEGNGGYILAPAHTIQHDVPPANLLAVYQGAKEFYA